MKRLLVISILMSLSLASGFSDPDEKRLGFGQQFDIEKLDIKQFSLTEILSKPEVLLALINPVEYEVTPGDNYELIIGADLEKRYTYPLHIEADYMVELPYLGSFNCAGLKYSAFRIQIIKGIKAKAPLPYIEVVLRMPAILDVFVYGGVDVPGFVKVTSANRLLEALLFAKGPKKGASFRRVQLIRGDKTITCDLARYLNQGDLSHNPYLKPGDKIYVPHPEIVVNIAGGVKYPGFYELVPGETLQDLINFAGGTLPNANSTSCTVIKNEPGGNNKMNSVELAKAETLKMGNGDAVVIPMTAVYEGGGMIVVEGAVYGKPIKPGEPIFLDRTPKPLVFLFPYYPGLTVLSLLEQVGGPNPFALADESYVERKNVKQKMPVDADKLWKTKDSAFDLVLAPGDHLVIPMIELVVFVGGEVHTPGAVPYISGKTASDYLLYAGGPTRTADPDAIYLVFRDGKRTKIAPTQEISPGAILFLDRNGWEYFKDLMTNLTLFTGLVSSVITIAEVVVNIIWNKIPQ
jgi:protein involved in polysaccharide export with SLBB domain